MGGLIADKSEAVTKMQFLVERWHGEEDYYPQVVPQLPIPIWVYYPPEKTKDGYTCDAAVLYKVTPESLDELHRMFPEIKFGNCVCEHLGHLIE